MPYSIEFDKRVEAYVGICDNSLKYIFFDFGNTILRCMLKMVWVHFNRGTQNIGVDVRDAKNVLYYM